MQVETIKKCRICLFIGKGKELIDWNSLVEECFEETKTYRDCFQICTGLATTESEELPKMLCHTCATELKAVYKFIRKARKSNEKLLALEKTRKGFVFEEFSALDDFDDWEEDDVERENLYESYNEDCSLDDTSVSEIPRFKIPKNKYNSVETCDTNEEIPLDDSAYWDAYAAEELYESSKEEEESEKDDKPKPFSYPRRKHEMCEYCNTEFLPEDIKRHIRKNHKRLISLCHKCPLAFKKENELRRHLETHDENRERKYICNICGVKLLTKKTYTFHTKTHELNFGYKCNQCSKSFKHKYSLKMHNKIHENGSTCLTCGKSWRSERALIRHVCLPRGTKRNTCSQCGKTFKHVAHLKNHLRLHEGLRYTCDICKKQYRYYSTLIQHHREHFGMPLKCTICEKGFGRISKVKRHIANLHKIESPEEIEKHFVRVPPKPLDAGTA